MTDKQYEAAVQKGLKFYKIYFKGTTLKKVLVPNHTIENNWINRAWVNDATPYDSYDKTYFRYVTSDRVESEAMKLVQYLRKESEDEIRRQQKQLDKLSKIQEKLHQNSSKCNTQRSCS